MTLSYVSNPYLLYLLPYNDNDEDDCGPVYSYYDDCATAEKCVFGKYYDDGIVPSPPLPPILGRDPVDEDDNRDHRR